MFGPWVLNEIWITNLSSALNVMLMSSSKLYSFSKEVHLNSGVTLLLELYCVVLIKQVTFFTIYLGKINSAIHMYQVTFEPLHLCFRMWLWVRIWTKILADRRIWRKKATDRWICIPLFTPLGKATKWRQLCQPNPVKTYGSQKNDRPEPATTTRDCSLLSTKESTGFWLEKCNFEQF